MTDDKRPSKAQLQRQVEALRKKAGWNPAAMVKESPMEALQRLDQEAQDEQVYSKSNGCAHCMTQRENSGDETALCDEHLAQALMGD